MMNNKEKKEPDKARSYPGGQGQKTKKKRDKSYIKKKEERRETT